MRYLVPKQPMPAVLGTLVSDLVPGTSCAPRTASGQVGGKNRSSALTSRAFFVSPGSLGKLKQLALGRAQTCFNLPYPGGLDEKCTSAANRAFGAILADNFVVRRYRSHEREALEKLMPPLGT